MKSRGCRPLLIDARDEIGEIESAVVTPATRSRIAAGFKRKAPVLPARRHTSATTMAAITATPVVLSARARVAPSGSAVRAAAVVRPKLSKRSVTVFAKKGECADLFFRPPAVANKEVLKCVREIALASPTRCRSSERASRASPRARWSPRRRARGVSRRRARCPRVSNPPLARSATTSIFSLSRADSSFVSNPESRRRRSRAPERGRCRRGDDAQRAVRRHLRRGARPGGALLASPSPLARAAEISSRPKETLKKTLKKTLILTFSRSPPPARALRCTRS